MEFLKTAQPLITMLVGIATLIGMLLMAYKTFKEPDEKASIEIALIKQSCVLKHTGLDKTVATISEDIRLIKENDLKHIESHMNSIDSQMARLGTILEERLPTKK